MKVSNRSGECAICGQKTYPFFSAPCDYRKPVNSKSYNVNWCSACDFGQVWERPNKDEVLGFYALDDYYTHYDISANVSSREDRVSFYDKIRMHIAWRLDNSEELTLNDAISLLKGDSYSAIDIGCGNGGNLLKFISKGFSAVGVEPDPEARKNAISAGLDVFEGTGEELPEAILTKKYDVVLMSHVLEHCLDINSAVSNAKSILNNGGVFIVETPNCKAYGFKKYKAEWPWSDIPRHLNFFTPLSLKSIIKKHSLNVFSVKYRGFNRQFSNSWLENEKNIWRALAARNSAPDIMPNFKLRAWKLLLKSIFFSKASKYDSVRLFLNSLPEIKGGKMG